MTDKMDRGLDEIIAETRPERNDRPHNRRGAGRPRREPRPEYPRDGVRKSFRDRDESRNLDSEWVHDRFEDNNSRRGAAPRRRRDSPEQDNRGSKVRVDNIHYDLTEEDLDELFKRIGPVIRLQLRYDRAGRSEGTAYVTYEQRDDALDAIRQFDGANANGQPIRLTMLPSGPARNPFDTAVMPGRPLAERISAPGGRTRSLSPRRYDEDDASRRGIDRYIPGQGSRSRSPMPRRRGGDRSGRGDRGGRRPGGRRDSPRDQESGRGGRGNPRPKKTQEELDAEMDNYFGGNGTPSNEPAAAAAPAAAALVPTEDVDMIE